MVNKLCLNFLIVFITLGFIGCGVDGNHDSSAVTCAIKVDTTWVYQDQEHGFYLISDTLTLWSGMELMDDDVCDSIGYRHKAIWAPSDEKRKCRLSDLFPPFRIFKRRSSDTLFVIQEEKTFLFHIPTQWCSE